MSVLRHAWFVLPGVILALAPGRAPAGVPATNAAVEFKRLERDIPSLYLLNGLHLTTGQAAKLSAIHRQAAKLEERGDRIVERLVGKAARDADRQIAGIVAAASRGHSADESRFDATITGGRLRECRRGISESRWEQSCKLDRLADEVHDMLTESQLKTVQGFVPCFIPSRDFRDPERVGQAAQDNTLLENALTRLRSMPENECFDGGLDAALSRIVPEVMYKRHISYTEEAWTEVRDELEPKLRAAAKRARALDDADFSLDRASLASKVFSPAETLRTDANAMRWKIRQYLMNTGISDVIAKRAGAKTVSPPPARVPAEREVLDLGAEIRTAGLVAGLNLSPGQATGVLAVVKSALDERRRLEKIAAKTMAEAIAPYMALRGGLAGNEPAPKDESLAAQCHGRVREIHEVDLVESLLPRQKEMDGLLSASQLALLLPCETDEQRGAGKGLMRAAAERGDRIESSRDQARSLLGEARRMSALEFSRGGGECVRDFVSSFARQNGAELVRVDVEAETARILKLLSDARAMKDTAFRESLPDLIAATCPRSASPRPSEYSSKFRNGKPLPELPLSTRLLFTENACAILAKMAAR